MKNFLFISAATFVLIFVGCNTQKTEINSTNENAKIQNALKTDAEWLPADDNNREDLKGVEEKAVDMKNAKFPDGAFKVVVSENGFMPQEISYKQGQPLKLAFYRADDKNCGSEIVFKDLNIKKKLPVGKVVLVDIPTDKANKFSFACGMDLMKGKIVVQ